jgi:predicted nucleotidyltransferase
LLRIDKYSYAKLKKALEVFDDVEVIFFGSRKDFTKRGGDIDIAIKGLSKEEFKKRKIKFFKILLLNDFDLPVDLVRYESASNLLKSEIENEIRFGSKI